MGLWMECIGFFIFARGPRRFIGPASFSLGQGDGPANGAYFQTLSIIKTIKTILNYLKLVNQWKKLLLSLEYLDKYKSSGI